MFRIAKTDGEIPPGETEHLEIVALLDDTIAFSGKLSLVFRYLSPMALDICAKGTGTALVSSIDMSEIDFDHMFTGESVTRTFTLENKGRRPQEVKWNQTTAQLEHGTNASFTYSLLPDSCVIEPRQAVQYTLTLKCNVPTRFELSPLCSATIGQTRYDLFQPRIHGIFINPSLTFHLSSLLFRYIHDVEKEEEISGKMMGKSVISPSVELLLPMSTPNSVTNRSVLPLDIVAKCPAPFAMSITNFSLSPGEAKEFSVAFKTDFKRNFTSQFVEGNIVFTFVGLPHTQLLPVRGAMIFPNIELSPEKLAFGSLLKYTEQAKIVRVANTSEVAVDFLWELLSLKDTTDVSKIFDVYPIRGRIEPGDAMDVHVTFFAYGEKGGQTRYHASAICHVIGGPDYALKLTGASADINYKLTPTLIDFGDKFYNEKLSGTFVLRNTSDIPLTYKLKVPRGCSFLDVTIDQTSGTLQVDEEQRFEIEVIPGIPKRYKDRLFFEINQFAEAEVQLRVSCCFPQLAFSIPRSLNDPLVAQYKQEVIPESKAKKLEHNLFSGQLATAARSGSSKPTVLRPSDLRTVAGRTRFSGFVLGRFVVDMGSITFGETPTVYYTFYSVVPCPISIEFQTQMLAGSGFSLDPMSVESIKAEQEVRLSFSFDAQLRTHDRVGGESYDIHLIMNQDLCYVITLKAMISMPALEVSKTHLEFDPTLVGQACVQNIQLQNMLSIPVEYSIGDAIQLTVLQCIDKSLTKIFVANPNSGVLPPSSFQIIDIIFSPLNERTYALQFPVTLSNNTNTTLSP
jgi:hydrocephalus-inducing protein